ncbi:hypothetical protein C8D91_2262 [Marinicella litoralis]|uniref:Uncharacterized protein n=1 Tax=Marinicella litoralis TaxID=644220 RepID=A0A4R6XG38_9GAMM|nr:hypothetical protein C8D91_2262 [Marinicella litoralis]
MTLCPYAMVAGCEKCPILKVCPLKSVIGNQPKKAESDKNKDSAAE